MKIFIIVFVIELNRSLILIKILIIENLSTIPIPIWISIDNISEVINPYRELSDVIKPVDNIALCTLFKLHLFSYIFFMGSSNNVFFTYLEFLVGCELATSIPGRGIPSPLKNIV